MHQRRPLLSRVLPSSVLTAETYDLVGDDEVGSTLVGDEERLVAAAVTKRRREFATARRCARQAMVAIGVEPVPVPAGHRGAPRWPAGLVGSLTHCDGFCGAALARATQVLSVGIDAEPHDVLPPGVLDLVALPEERVMLRSLGSSVAWDRLLFGAKEAIYKACSPVDGLWRDFTEMRVRIGRNGTFRGEPVPGAPPAPGPLEGRWVVEEGLVVVGLALATPTDRTVG
ncbi:4'-phosphopantetheinyl transferase superfamily protein [Luteipulveratus sp. YIM 133132]|uniref:4'-phosphopantetheinyl transferase family protein n=1 Tax=Luteipulveratus flavus TaxID=3031728 RepID=UPI0023B01FA2|nr:4'-phosphopantetheinyl transferase superfamily protein [Luteipulveratus sp. YIM 133132]MDE9366381.1 4'-phosphopantetheinyl transferase superfamily protein [Luteipulveratus sp. YIM 133132]